MRLSAVDEPGWTHERIAGRGHYADVFLNGEKVQWCVRANDERGFVDVQTRLINPWTHDYYVDRLWGEVKIVFGNYLTEREISATHKTSA